MRAKNSFLCFVFFFLTKIVQHVEAIVSQLKDSLVFRRIFVGLHMAVGLVWLVAVAVATAAFQVAWDLMIYNVV